MKIAKVYVVCRGRMKGIFDTWNDCRTNVDHYHGSKYKSFTESDEALYYIRAEMKPGGPYCWLMNGEKCEYRDLEEFIFAIESYYDAMRPSNEDQECL